MVEVQSEQLLQIDSDIKIDPSAKEALGYLVDQFPTEYIDPKTTKKVEPQLSQQEKDEIEKKTVIDYSTQVAQEAS